LSHDGLGKEKIVFFLGLGKKREKGDRGRWQCDEKTKKRGQLKKKKREGRGSASTARVKVCRFQGELSGVGRKKRKTWAFLKSWGGTWNAGENGNKINTGVLPWKKEGLRKHPPLFHHRGRGTIAKTSCRTGGLSSNDQTLQKQRIKFKRNWPALQVLKNRGLQDRKNTWEGGP